jgi:hypothetical protein
MFQLAFTWATDQIICSLPSSRGSSTCPWYSVAGNTSEQRINIKFCAKTGTSTNETLVLLRATCDEYSMKKSSISEWHRRFKEGQEDMQDDSKSGHPKTQRTDYKQLNEVLTRIRESVRRKDPNSGLKSGFSTMKCPCARCVKSSRVKKPTTKMYHTP